MTLPGIYDLLTVTQYYGFFARTYRLLQYISINILRQTENL